ncbi:MULTISPECIES: 5-bromo-4-chloroindolyl phosphate hydrolysis family protein [Enterococcus]|uniref:5-bromo-4-chloroindolyl phosphate hydrolysis protein n=2 Tax=Enterococcus durans TaxID=53345 RepID=A0A377L389_9ENTE|nr:MULTISPECIES: 5-bromo-4-chloroindolyl phosphate hydrolysis family protein [Enterococcus]QCJ64851.1 5-bromo-4-chloroindolyl phosphate hydrolysis protein [Lactobacillus sp. Koumiss]AKX86287.1 5-bromo-4-chloroindolyl phosphate hydrolysis protein [Enterococcus durans]AKZ47657.1 5-bromo-4-chloroindolyl phosphate hydrolysis protein [Enterococcus durans]EOT34389.1 5-bromo-4-chloroindolyl phosphate hydrolysis protein [Enterococcus durans ATCC 6056]EOU25813.1 5-bromo-4-chloroindolyl phosphate hydrol
MLKRNWRWIVALLIAFFYIRLSGYSLITLLLVVGTVFIIWGLFGSSKKKKRPAEIPDLSKELEAHYEESGMTPSEITFFRQTMNQTKTEISQLQQNMQQTAKLKSIDLRHDTVKAAKALFKELVKEPHRLHEASQFLYTHLPNLIDLTNKYIEINDHEIKNKQTYAKLEESAVIIDQLASLIAQDYQKFVSDDLDDLDVELSIAKQSLKRDNELERESNQ